MSSLVDFPEKALKAVFHASRGGLLPTLPAENPRYSTESSVTCSHTTIPAWTANQSGLPQLLSVPRGWESFVHPEGKVYFRRRSHPVILTESYICRPEIFTALLSWIGVIEDWIRELPLVLHESVHIWAQLSADQNSCMYSLIDHAQRSVFWLQALTTDVLGLSESVSQSHLSQLLQEQYWAHVEHFPMGIERLPSEASTQLIDIFTHAYADNITSATSTFPYPLEECTQILQLLRDSQGRLSEAGTICFVARIWTFICNNRHLNHWGQEICRMSRDQKISSAAPPKSSILLSALSCLGLNCQQHYRSGLDDVYHDSIVYLHVWKTFVRNTLEDWSMWSKMSFALLIANTLTLPMAWSQALTLASTLLCLSSFVMSLVLHQHLTSIPEGISLEASTYLYEHCGTYGFAPLALVYSLPKSLFVYGLLCFCTQAVCMLFRFFDPSIVPIIAGIAIAVVGIAALAIARILCPSPASDDFEPRPSVSTWSRLTSWLRSRPVELPHCSSDARLVDIEKLSV
ncbi:hypothetical protein EVG20_g3202 [Dentipellis fragilis]|uniref:WW domain-containing protein n=1 Tax=Dentipellis fragilis TaxID=205917 RepID=A0A4Y9Z5J9_9AGAM|nr:hypothetical protein EVG20_g3202 [Dentipellis fragilis]